jgi:hypothetical protein
VGNIYDSNSIVYFIFTLRTIGTILIYDLSFIYVCLCGSDLLLVRIYVLQRFVLPKFSCWIRHWLHGVWVFFLECEQCSFVRKLLWAANVFGSWLLTLFYRRAEDFTLKNISLSLPLGADFSVCSGYHFSFLRGLWFKKNRLPWSTLGSSM